MDGYVVFTMDKLIALIAKSLVSLANDAGKLDFFDLTEIGKVKQKYLLKNDFPDCFETLKQYDKFRMEKPPSVYDRSDRKNT